MGFEQEKTDRANLAQYDELGLFKAGIEEQVQRWVDNATALYTAVSTDATKQSEIMALRTNMIANLKTILQI